MKSHAVSSAVLAVSLLAMSGCASDSGNEPSTSSPAVTPMAAEPLGTAEGLTSSMASTNGTIESDSGTGSASGVETVDSSRGSTGGAGSPSEGVSSAAASRDTGGRGLGSCTAVVTGDLEGTYTDSIETLVEGPVELTSVFRTRYWMSEADVQARIEKSGAAMRDIFGSISESHTPDPNADPTAEAAVRQSMAEVAATIVAANTDSGMLGQVAPIFSLGCSGTANDTHFIVGFGNLAADEAQIPLSPGRYAIPAEDGFGAAMPGSKPFIPIVTTSDAAPSASSGDGMQDMINWQVSVPGTFEITRFDAERAEGTFEFDAAEKPWDADGTPSTREPRSIHVAGQFAFRCAGGPGCGQR